MNNLVIITKLLALTISLFSFLFYMLRFVFKNKGVPESFSWTWLKIEKKIQFTLFIWCTFLPFLAFCFNPIRPLLVIGIGLTVLVGSFPMINNKVIRFIHRLVISKGILLCYYSLWYYFGIYEIQIILIIFIVILLLISLLLYPYYPEKFLLKMFKKAFWVYAKEYICIIFWIEVLLYIYFVLALSSLIYPV